MPPSQGPRRLVGHLLLKRLTDDALGATWRAGVAAPDGSICDLRLVRELSRPGLRAAVLAEGFAERAGLLETLPRSPFLPQREAAGAEDGRFALAYPYASGRTLGAVVALGAERRCPLPPDVAIFVVERLSQASQTAASAGGHGFLVPDLVWVTADGEVWLLGLEVAPALRRQLGATPELAPFLSPAARSGAAPAELDDVYSLAAILHLLLTGEPPHPDISQQSGATLASATMAEDGAPLPPQLQDLLERGLAAADHRPARVESWRQALTATAAASGWTGSAFQLAVTMHRMLDDVMAGEADEIAAEREAGGPLQEPAAAPPPEALAPLPVEMPAPHELAAPGPQEAPRRKRGPVIAAAAVAVLLLGAGVAWLVGREAGEDPPSAPATSADAPSATRPPPPTETAAEAEPVVTVVPAPGAPSVEELEAQVERLLAERAEELSAEHSQRMEALERQLAEAREEEAEARRVAEDRPEPTAVQPAAAAAAERPAEEAQRPAEATTAAATGATSEPPPPVAAGPAAEERPIEPGPSAQSAPSAAVPGASQPAPSVDPDPVRRGELVEPGPGVVPPRLLGMDTPEYPLQARRAKIGGTVVLALLVDEEGRVAEVKLLRRVPENVGLNESATEAARGARFRAATKDGVPVSMWYTLTVPFRL